MTERLTKDEQMLLLQLLLEDMRGSFPLSGWSDKRMVAAHALAEELGLAKHAARIKELAEYDNYRDGRHFRTSFDYGGYEGMSEHHPLKPTFHDKSELFRKRATSLLEYPECQFDDWEVEE